MKKLMIICFLGIQVFLMYSFGSAENEILFPEGYRNWTHIKTAINNPDYLTHAGFHHIYANKKALKGFNTGHFPDGSILVFDVLEATQQKNGDVIEGKRKLIDVMVKNVKRFSDTGGWGYQEFIYGANAGIKSLNPTKSMCFNCHNSVKDNDFVFSKYRV